MFVIYTANIMFAGWYIYPIFVRKIKDLIMIAIELTQPEALSIPSNIVGPDRPHCGIETQIKGFSLEMFLFIR